MLAYDEVVVYSNTEYDDPVALGNVIADYQDAGGVVVATNANWWGPPYGMDGRWMTGGYTMYTYPAAANDLTSTLGTYDANHPLMQGVTALTAFFRNQVTLTSGASQVAAWADDLPWWLTRPPTDIPPLASTHTLASPRRAGTATSAP